MVISIRDRSVTEYSVKYSTSKNNRDNAIIGNWKIMPSAK